MTDSTTIRRTKIAGFRTFYDGLKKAFPMKETLIKPLRLCPCCKSAASVSRCHEGGPVIIACSKQGCRIVEGKDYESATILWNAPSFRDSPCKRT